jgi:dTDP-4-amino-4,6-dideoxygalactose transaminase
MKVPMLNLAAEFEELADDLERALHAVLRSGQFILGEQGAALESEIARYLGVSHAVAVANGTDALHLALRAAGIGPGHDVVTPSYTFAGTAEAIVHAGARPVFADIGLSSYNLEPDALTAALTPATRAVIVVHLFGQTADLPAIAEVCARREIVLIEDCAQAFGADWEGRRAGSWGSLGCFSFYPTKNLGACGDAGMIVTGDARLADRVRMLRHHGIRGAYRHELVGFNSRLDEIQAAILRIKLAHVERANARRRAHADAYRRLLNGGPVALPQEHGRGRHVYHQFTIRAFARDAVREALAAKGIATAVYYPVPVHRQPAFEPYARGLALPATERAAGEALSLPLYPQLTAEAIEYVCATLLAAATKAVKPA